MAGEDEFMTFVMRFYSVNMRCCNNFFTLNLWFTKYELLFV